MYLRKCNKISMIFWVDEKRREIKLIGNDVHTIGHFLFPIVFYVIDCIRIMFIYTPHS